MDNVPGMRDRFGAEPRRRRYLTNSFAAVVESFGYEPVRISLIEKAEAYSEEIVGLSPWPEWNRRGCFFFEVDDFMTGYDEVPQTCEVVLVPEGTLSITRWLGSKLSNDQVDSLLPLKIYYEQQCFRNELLSTVSKTKGREFSQFGLEILGATGPLSDIEPLVLANEMLKAIAPGGPHVRFRVSSNGIFLKLWPELNKTGLSGTSVLA